MKTWNIFAAVVALTAGAYAEETMNRPFGGSLDGLAVGAEQKSGAVVLVDASKAGAPAFAWEWNSARDPGVRKENAEWFRLPSDCRMLPGRVLLMTASGGAFARIPLATGRVDAYGYVGGNPHAAEPLPGGQFVVTASSGGYLTLVDISTHPMDPEQQFKRRYPLEGAHGVVWDEFRNCLWAIGGTNIVCFAWNPRSHELLETAQFDFNAVAGTSGHELQPDGRGGLFFSTISTVAHLDPDTGAMRAVRARKDVKSFSRNARYGDLSAVVREVWWTDRLLVDRDGAEYVVGPYPGTRFYKVRWAETEPPNAPLAWPDVTQTMKPWAYNWWLGGAVDEAGLENQCAEMERAHFGGFHVVHAYVSFYNSTHRSEKPHPSCIPEEEWRPFMSNDWLTAWNSAVRIARGHGLGVDLSLCSGWCYGGPWVTKEDACSSLLPVHVSGPGGEGYHIDPFSPTAMSNHLARFEAAFGRNGTAERPRAIYHDSFEYYGARPKHGENVDEAQLATFGVWSDWCRENGYISRNQAHGSPGNWLDLYALATIPETEMCFNSRGGSRDILLSKFASSAAHVTGKRLISAETCTWVEEHFRERPKDVKLMLDQLFLSGINHVFFHGYCYSPVGADWPGRCFFASLQMNPRNPLWREVTTLADYVIRCQSIFQTWRPDNDLLVRWDPDEFRAADPKNACRLMTVHDGKDWFHPTSYGKRARELWADGYQFDFVSDRQLAANPSLRARLDAANARPSPFSPKANGLMSTRWRKGGRTLHFVVNTLDEPRVLTGRFTVMDPMTGRISDYTRYVLHPLSSVFVETGDVTVSGPGAKPQEHPLQGLSWRVSPVAGGPVLPPATNLTELVSWSAWDEVFSGTMRYETTFDRPAGCAASAALDLDLGDVREAAHVWLNGVDLGCVLVRPYRFRLSGALLKERGNKLCVEVSSLGANRIRWICRTNQPWKRFAEENFVNSAYKPFDAEKWDVQPCGLLGPVVLCARESVVANQGGLDAAETVPMVLATDQKEGRLVLLSPCAGTNDDSAISWTWSPKEDPGVKPEDVALFACPDECKLRDGGRTILLTASGGAFAEIDVATRRVRAYGNVGGNPHSVDRLPDGAYVVASSDGNRLTVVDVKGAELNPAAQRKTVFPLSDAHGVEWDARRNCLWAITVWDVVRYSYDSERKSLTRTNTYSFKTIGFGGGHDLVLFPSPKGDRLWLTAHEGVASLDPDTGAFEVIARGGTPSVSRCGSYRLFLRSTERWWTDAVTAFSDSDADKPLVFRLKGARFYKVKLFRPTDAWRLDRK